MPAYALVLRAPRRAPATVLALAALLALPWAAQAQPAAAPAQATAAGAAGSTGSTTCPALLQHSFPRLQDDKPQALCQYAGKVLLVVNTASFCGFTSQYEGLEALHARFGARGLVVMGFPSNDFNQETSDTKRIADLCFNTYGVKFPMFAPSGVKGPGANPLFAQLAQATGKAPGWNFNKYLVGRNGQPLAHFGSSVGPQSVALVSAIEKALGTP